jgi:hypothetical protein
LGRSKSAGGWRALSCVAGGASMPAPAGFLIAKNR